MRIDVEGASLYVDVEGASVVAAGDSWVERPTVVLLHPGPGADHSVYKDLIGPRLAEVAQVVYVDLRGDGRSETGAAEDWNIERWAADVVAIVDALGIRKPVLYGTSTGGLVALRIAARWPELADRVVLASVVARIVHGRMTAEFDRLGGAAVGETAARYFAQPDDRALADYFRVCRPHFTRQQGLDPDVLARMQLNPAATIHWDAVEAGKVDARADAAAVSCAVLLVTGEDDPVSPLASVQELADAFAPDVLTFRAYSDAGHGVVRDAPDALDEIVAFVRRPASA